MPSYKRHHYVPKFLLRQFSGDGKRVDVFQFNSRRMFQKVGIKEQCSESFYYGKDPKLESAFSELEDRVSKTIRSISKLDFEGISAEDITLFRQFLLYQAFRTKGAAERLQRFTDASMKPLMREISVSENIPPSFVDRVKFELTSPQFWSLHAASGAIPAVMDLDLKILITSRDSHLIISDNPVVLYNQFAEHHKKLGDLPGALGLTSRGLQIFLPISPIFCVCLYDPQVYQYGRKGSALGRMSKKDAFRLNVLQAVYAEKCLYWFPGLGPHDKDLKNLVECAGKAKGMRKNEVKVGVKQHQGVKTSQIILTHAENVQIGAKFSFAQVKDRGSYEGHLRVPARSKELVEEVAAFRRQLAREAELELDDSIDISNPTGSIKEGRKDDF